LRTVLAPLAGIELAPAYPHRMNPDEAGSRRIVVVGADGRPHAPARPPRDVHPPREPPAKQQAVTHGGWTTRRLAIAGALGAGATVLGGLTFLSKFGILGANDSPLLAMGFGLFVIGMVVFCAALIALLGTGLSVIAANSGWTPVAGVVGVPLALAWAIYGVGAVGYAAPAVLSLVLIGGLVVALK
jgi:hypothetical protein